MKYHQCSMGKVRDQHTPPWYRKKSWALWKSRGDPRNTQEYFVTDKKSRGTTTLHVLDRMSIMSSQAELSEYQWLSKVIPEPLRKPTRELWDRFISPRSKRDRTKERTRQHMITTRRKIVTMPNMWNAGVTQPSPVCWWAEQSSRADSHTTQCCDAVWGFLPFFFYIFSVSFTHILVAL